MAIQMLAAVDFNGIPVQNLVAQTVTSNPTWTSADEGRIIYNSTTGNVYFGDSAGWVQLSEGSGFVSESRTITASTGLSGGGDLTADRSLAFDTTWGDARYATLSGATFTGNVSLGTVQLLQGSAGLMDATQVSASLFKSSLTSAGVTSDGVYLFEDGAMVALVIDSGRLHVTYTNNTGALIKSETSQADNTYHAAVKISADGVDVYVDNSGSTPVADSSYSTNATVAGDLAVTGTSTFTGAVTVPTTPSAAGHAASKQYVDVVAQGLSVKAPVVAIATSNITLSGAQTIDGVSVVADDRVLVAGQTNAVENGIYVAAAGAWARADDADASGEIKDGSVLWVEAGTSSGDALYVCTATGSDPWVPDTDTSTWTKYTSISDLAAGDGLTKTGTTIDVVAADATLTVNADSIAVASAPQLTTARDFSITGDVTASAVSFDGTGNVALSATLDSSVPKMYAGNVGAGTSVVVTHSLGTTDVTVQVFEIASGDTVLCDVERTSTNTVTLGFASAVSADAYRCLVSGI